MRIAILQYPDAVPSSMAGPADILGTLIRVAPTMPHLQLKVNFEIDMVFRRGTKFWRQPLEKKAVALTPQWRYDLIIIPAMVSGKIAAVLAREKEMIAWVRRQHARKTQVASICVGAFLLAETGILKGKKATTHWRFAQLFRSKYPDTLLVDDKIIVDDDDVLMCGGAFSFTTFMIYIIEKFCGHETAVMASKILMINMHQEQQTVFSVFRFQHDHGDVEILQAQEYLEKNYANEIFVDKLASQQNMSLRNFSRRFQQATANTPLEYLQRVRMEAAKHMLENRRTGIEQIAMQCGYIDPAFFRKIFKRHVTMTPKEYQEKYGKDGLRQIVSKATIRA